MENSETTIPIEHVEPSHAPVEPPPEPEPAQALPSEPPAPQPSPAEARKGRPQGSKDRQPRTRRPTIRVESLPAAAPEPVAEPAGPPRVPPRAAPTPAATPPEPLEEPPSPQTLYRETSQRRVHLRGILNECKRSNVAEKYTSRLSSWAA